MIIYLVALLCVFGLAVGQLLFKVSANASSAAGSFLSFKAIAALCAACCLYGLTSIAWVWVLQRIQLGKVYPLMALAFVLVPMGSFFFFGERFSTQYVFGVLFIAAGVLLTSAA
jgi:drug/metabolite transporter (DMT)-like permease